MVTGESAQKSGRPSTYLESVKDGGEVSPLSVVSPLSEYLWVCGAPVLVRHRVHRLVVVVVHGPGDAVPGEPTVDFTRRHLDLSRHKIEKSINAIICNVFFRQMEHNGNDFECSAMQNVRSSN